MRLEFVDALYHITARENESKVIYADEADFEVFLEILDSVCLQHNWRIRHGAVGHLLSAIANPQSPDWLATDANLRCFGAKRSRAINAYIEFVCQGLHKRIWDKLKHQIYLGDDDFVKNIKHCKVCSMAIYQKCR